MGFWTFVSAIDSIKKGKVYSADEVDAVLAKEYGI